MAFNSTQHFSYLKQIQKNGFSTDIFLLIVLAELKLGQLFLLDWARHLLKYTLQHLLLISFKVQMNMSTETHFTYTVN